ncbi:hypothetical protein ACWOBA_00110 [Gemella taiwanensis]|jgi:hypothetical protein
MQLSKEEQTKLDTIIERYMDDTTSKEAIAIETYLNKINSLERELLMAVYFNFSRKATDEENKVINEHKVKLFNLLSDKGYIKANNSLPLKRTSKSESGRKIKRLSQLKKLTEVITLLHNRLYSLELELKTYDSVTTSSVNIEKVNTSKQSYNFGSFKISSEIDEVKEIIQSKTIEWEKEREFLKDVFEQIKDVKEQHIFYLRYINCLSWDDIALKFDKSDAWCKKVHTRNIKILKL